MPKKNSSNKYINDNFNDSEGGSISGHYYQNSNVSSKTKIKTRIDRSGGLNENPRSNGNLASSSSSSQKPLISTYDKKVNKKYFFIVLAIISLLFCLITTAITFIFPLWVTLTIKTNTATPNAPINITNTLNGVTLIASESYDLKIYLGLWEVKMDRELTLYDPNGSKGFSKNSYPQSMLWLNADSNKPSESFLVKFAQFIDLPVANLFVVQILQILHLTFIFFSFSFTSFALCLCSSESFCWYIFCLFLSLISFLLGASVLGLLVYWDTFHTDHITLVDDQMRRLMLQKDYNWCFWASVGINSAILLACFLILIYILVSVCIACLKSSRQKSSSILHPPPLSNLNESPEMARLPRVTPPLSPLIGSYPAERLTYQSQKHAPPNVPVRHAIPTTPPLPPIIDNNNTIQNEVNSQYIFYTGHGNYHKQKIETPPPAPPPENHAKNYSMVMSQQQSNNQRYLNANVIDQNQNHLYNDYRFPSYR